MQFRFLKLCKTILNLTIKNVNSVFFFLFLFKTISRVLATTRLSLISENRALFSKIAY